MTEAKTKPERSAPTLQQLFTEQSADFSKRIQCLNSISSVSECVKDLLDSLQDTFIETLSVPQARIASSFFNSLRATVSILDKVTGKEAPAAPHSTPAGPVTREPKARLIAASIRVGVTLAVLLAVIHVSLTGTVLLIVLLVLLVLDQCSALVELLRDWNPPWPLRMLGWPEPSKVNTFEEPSAVIVMPIVDHAGVSDALIQAFSCIDRAMANLKTVETPEDTPLIPPKAYSDILDHLQKLASASYRSDADIALAVSRESRGVLAACGINSHFFDPQMNSDFFDREPALTPDIQEYTTDLAALTSGGRLIKRGRVLEPYTPEA